MSRGKRGRGKPGMMIRGVSALATVLGIARQSRPLLDRFPQKSPVSVGNLPSRSHYSPEIDGLRALAVISVIINHFNTDLLPSGYVGVDIFFVISGYVIASSLYNSPGKTLADVFLGFYTRRVKRLVPALILCVVITGVLICLFDERPGASLKTGITSLFGLSNIYLLRRATDYFASLSQLNVFMHTWSLGVEEQFYILFPFIVWFTGFGRAHPKGLDNLGRVVGVLAIGSLVAFVPLSASNQPAAFFLMPTRLWELSAGSLVFVALNRVQRSSLRLLARVSPLVVMLSIVAVLFIPAQFFVRSTIAVVLLTALLIASIRPRTTAYQILSHPTAVYVGRISYSLYLWHWSVLAISRWTIGIHWWCVPLQAGLMLLLAGASYRYVENPMRHAEWSAFRWRSIGYGLSALVGAAALLAGLAKPLDGRLYTGRPRKLVAEGVESLTDTYYLRDVPGFWQGEKCVVSDNRQVGKVIPIDECTLGNFSSARRRVLVLGNSYSAAFVQAFDQLVQSDKYSVTVTSSWGASPVAEIPNSSPWDKANDYYWRAVVPSLVSRLRAGDWVFLINDMADLSPEQASVDSTQRLRELEMGLARLSDRLAERGVGLAVLHGVPFAREADCEPALAAPQWFAPFGSPCRFFSKEQTLSRRARLNQILSSLRDQGKIAIVDLIDVFCPRKTCTYQASNGQTLYRDVYSHPSVEAARLSAPLIRDVLTAPNPSRRGAAERQAR